MTIPSALYTIRIRGRLGTSALSAFPPMVSEVGENDTGVIGQIEALGLELTELRDIRAEPRPHKCSPPRGLDVRD
jgi:hypothetical protein